MIAYLALRYGIATGIADEEILRRYDCKVVFESNSSIVVHGRERGVGGESRRENLEVKEGN
jgi:hypothetical protein